MFLEARIDFADFQFLKSCLKILDAQIAVFISCANIRKHIFVSQKCYRRKLMFPFVCMANKSKLPKLFSMDDQLDAASSLFDRYLMRNECYKLCKQTFPKIFDIAIGNYIHPFTL